MGRVLTFADPEVIKMARERFIPVAADDWYQRRRKDDEGAFFRMVSDQGSRRSAGDTGTRQGIYVFTASGKLLGFRNHHDPAEMKKTFRQALAAWDRLPAREREPGVVQIEDARRVDADYERALPKGSVIVNVYTRILDRDRKGEFCHGTCEFIGGDRSAHDRLWLTPEDLASFRPAAPGVGDRWRLPERVVRRIARFHLVDNTRGEPPHWKNGEVRKAEIEVEIVKLTDARIEMKLTGAFLLTTLPNPDRADRGFDLSVLGHVAVDRKEGRLERFDVVGIGEHWGAGPYTRKARPGRMPLGAAFELSPGDTPSDRVPPQGARWLQGYIEAEK